MATSDALAPSPATAWRKLTDSLARRRLALAVAAIYLFLAIIWFLFASVGALFIGLAFCSEACPVVSEARKVIHATSISLVLLTVIAGVGLVAAAFKKKAWNTEKQLAPLSKDVARAERQVLCVLVIGLVATVTFFLLSFVGNTMKETGPDSSVTGSHSHRTGTQIFYIGVMGGLGLYCFIIIPLLALFVGKMVSFVCRDNAFEVLTPMILSVK
ncbi:hypothetical protein QOZ80_8BG0659530 [Eleusine coracana subsp. coracana]|nr:hypothetical protein QOZ80_8BG0659530 [Eleusine coracana subsp. coracana]